VTFQILTAANYEGTFLGCSTLMMEAVRISETSVYFRETTAASQEAVILIVILTFHHLTGHKREGIKVMFNVNY
jgi:hypothetical protein